MLYNLLLYHRFDIIVTATEDTVFDAWIGAVLRNNLLYATEQIRISGQDTTLFRICQHFPLSEQHPLYKELKDGFPAPYYLFVRELDTVELVNLPAGRQISFSLVLIGEISRYISYFINAIDFMCRKGIGMYSKPFMLTEVREVSAMGENRIMYRNGAIVSDRLLFPVDMETVQSVLSTSTLTDRMRITFESPVCLIKQRKRSEVPGYQEMSNLFPGFYQIVRTAAYRLEKLNALYAAPDDMDLYNRSHEKIEPYLKRAAWLEIEEINLKRIELKSSRRKNRNETRIPLVGLSGEMIFRGNYKPYITILKFMENLGVGHALTFGFGKFKIEMI
ncbi:MAG: CRISPR system precrRNA processing endoribonuclease RAMP protein Cas6 [Tannerella sp.]|jgi:hypothetical protein|nr:CRISPR system precrRNA processing endoribonuclease RAMP protein Cas6 [Tannerella sp.]